MDEKNERKRVLSKQQNKNVQKQKSIRSQSDQQNKTIDILRLLSKKQRSRQSKIYYQPQTYNKKYIKQQVRHSDYPSNFRNQSYSINDEEQRYSTCANKPAPLIIKNINMLDQSFLSGNQSNSIIGIILYLLFIIFVSVQVIITTYIIPKQFSKYEFYLETALFTILLSELLYYVILRYLSQHTKKKLFLHASARRSFDKLMTLSKTVSKQQEKQYSNWLFQRPYLLLTTVIGTVIICQILYSKLATQINFLFQKTDKKYMVSTLFWSNFALPYIFSNFYLLRTIQDRNLKLKIFSIVIIVYMIQSLFEGFLFFSLMVFNLLQTYIQSKKQFDTFHINQLIKILLLIGVSFQMIMKYCFSDGNTLFSGQVFAFMLTLLFHVIVLTIGMLVTRIIAIKYIKQQLYRYYYTQTSINLGFIVVTLILNLTYLNQFHRNQTDIFISVVINLIFLTILAIIIYAEGRQRLQITMEQRKQQDY